jgi:hypothetical protein
MKIPERRRPMGRSRCRWEENIKMDITEVGWDGMDWIYVAKDSGQWRAFVTTVRNTFWFHKMLGCIPELR